MAELGAWHGDPELKAAVVERMRKHREADSFAQGFYQMHDPQKALGYKGCALGCMVEKQQDPYGVESFAVLVEEEFGIPAGLAVEIDGAFESLEFKDCAVFAVAIVEAIPVGGDLTGAISAYLAEMGAKHWDVTGTQMAGLLLRLVSQAPQVTA